MHAKHALGALAILPLIMQLTGCGSAQARPDSPSTVVPAATQNSSDPELQSAQQRIERLESELANKNRELEMAKMQDAPSDTTGADMTDDALFPPNAKPGQCYARVLTPARYQSVSERVLKRDASARVEIIPARYETVEERVLAKEASTRLEVIPPVYEDVTERVMVKPASEELREIPASYETVSERVLEKPAHTVWKRGPATTQAGTVLSSATSDTGEIMCLVEVPAKYKTVSKQVLVHAARTETVRTPAEYKSITKRVVKQPATTREVTVPAEYRTVKVTKLVTPAQERRIEIPAEYSNVTRNEKIADARLEWHDVLCQVNLTPENIVAIQNALNDKGFYAGPIDGIIGPLTISAANSYASAKGLAGGSNYITMEVVQSLGLSQLVAAL